MMPVPVPVVAVVTVAMCRLTSLMFVASPRPETRLMGWLGTIVVSPLIGVGSIGIEPGYEIACCRFGEPLHRFGAITVSACNLRPTSRGTLRLRSADPAAKPPVPAPAKPPVVSSAKPAPTPAREPGLYANVQSVGTQGVMLTERLRTLEAAGLIRRDYEPTIPPKVTYSLTARGHELDSVLDTLAAIAVRWEAEDASRRTAMKAAAE